MTLVDTNLISCYLRPEAGTRFSREHDFVDGLIETDPDLRLRAADCGVCRASRAV